jgi:hypothetical protein
VVYERANAYRVVFMDTYIAEKDGDPVSKVQLSAAAHHIVANGDLANGIIFRSGVKIVM